MRQFQITSTKYNGVAELLYNHKEVLCKIDCTQTDMDAETITAFKKACPATIEQLAAGRCFGAETIVVEKDFEVTFTMFWDEYKKKINKERTETVWNRLSKADKVKAWSAIKGYDSYLRRIDWRKKADPETYLTKQFYKTDWRNAE